MKRIALFLVLFLSVLVSTAGAQTIGPPFHWFGADSAEKVHSNTRGVISSGATPPFSILVLSGDGARFDDVPTTDTGFIIKLTVSNETSNSPIEEMLVKRVSGDTLFVVQRAPSVGKNLVPQTWQSGASVSVIFSGEYIKQLQDAIDDLVPPVAGKATYILSNDGTSTEWIAVPGITDSGSVSSVGLSGGATGLTVSGSPITTHGTMTLAGTLAVTNGGTGLTGVGANRLLYATSTNVLAATALGTGLSYSSGAINVSLSPFSTTDLAEGSNHYFTGPRFDSILSTKTTDGLPEGVTNLYYTNARADSRITIQKGALNGLASLDNTGKVFLTQLPVIPITNGGTGKTTRPSALVALLPDTTGQALKYLRYNPLASPTVYWDTAGHGGGGGGVSSVDVSGGTTGLTTSGGPITTTGTITLAGFLNAVNGGTGQTSYTTGDVLYASSSSVLSKLGIGSTGNVLTVSGGLPAWAAPAYTGTVSSVALALPGEFTISGSPVTTTGTLTGAWASQSQNLFFASPNGSTGTPGFRAFVAADLNTVVVPVANGGQGTATLAAHKVLVGAGTAPVTLVGVGASNTVLHGNTAADPSFSAVSLTADVSGVLPVANGGTGVATGTAHSIPIFEGTGALANTGAGTAASVLTSNGSSADPTWQTIGSIIGTGTFADSAVKGFPPIATQPIVYSKPASSGLLAIGDSANIFNSPIGSDSINIYDIAIGDHASATGEGSIAIGHRASALSGFISDARGSIAIGDSATAMREHSVAIGWLSFAGQQSTAIGGTANASGEYSLAIANGTFDANATGNGSIAIGEVPSVGGSGLAIDGSTYGLSAWNIMAGPNGYLYGSSVGAIGGQRDSVMGDWAASINGRYLLLNNYGVVGIGQYDAPITASPTTSYNTAAPAFIIGNGTSYAARSNAMVVYNNGNVTIGGTLTVGGGGAGTGTVTSVAGSGGTTGLTLTGGPITSSGTLTLGGTLAIANGGTGLSSTSQNYAFMGPTSGSGAPAWRQLVAGDLPSISGLDTSAILRYPTTNAQNTITTVDTTLTPLTIIHAPSQTGHYFQIYNGATLADYLDVNGPSGKSFLRITGDAQITGETYGGYASFEPTSTSVVPLTLQRDTSTSVDLLDILDYSGSKLAWVDNTGESYWQNLEVAGMTAWGIAGWNGSGDITSNHLTNGQLLIGQSGANAALAATLTAGTGVTITNGSGSITIAATGLGGTVTSVSGTTNQIDVATGTTTPVISIDAGYVGQSSITTLGTIGTGTWHGTSIDLAHGGTNANLTASNGGIFYSTGSAGAILAGTATANQMLMSNASSAPAWSTATYPTTTTVNQLLWSSSANAITGLATANNGVLVTGASGIPSIASTLPSAVQGNITSVGAIVSGQWSATTVTVPHGGTGLGTTITQYGVLYGNAAAPLGVVAINSGATQFLSQTSGGIPTWATLGGSDIPAIALTTGVSGILPVGSGGTGDGTLTSHGVLIGNVTSGINATAAGALGYVLTGQGATSDPIWAVNAALTNPMTTLGDIIYENSTPAPARLAGNTSATKEFLTQTGAAGPVSAAPVWGTIANTDVSGLGTLSTQSGTFSGTSSGTNTGDQTITLTGNVTGSGTGSFATTIANLAVTNAMIAATTIDLTAKVTGILPIANGGTNASTQAGALKNLTPDTTGNTKKFLGVTAGGGITWNSVGSGLTSTLVDLSGVYTVKDTNIGATLIAATSKPGSPQFTYKVLAADIPSNANVTDYEVFFTVYGANVNVSLTEAMNWRFTLNGTDIGSVDNTLSPTITSTFWKASGRFAAAAIARSDVIGIKLWVTNASQVNYIGATIYIVPRKLNVPLSTDLSANGPVSGTVMQAIGALGGVAYTADFSPSTGYYDPGTTFVNWSGGLLTIVPPQYFVEDAAFYNINQVSGTIQAVATLSSVCNLYRFFRRQY